MLMGLKRTWIALTGGMIICAGAEAQNFVPNFYFRGEIGPAVTEDTDIESFVGLFGPATVEFETGVRMGAAGGYSFCPWFALEGEIGWIYNEIDRVSGGVSADARLMQSPFLGNAVLQFRNPTGI